MGKEIRKKKIGKHRTVFIQFLPKGSASTGSARIWIDNIKERKSYHFDLDKKEKSLKLYNRMNSVKAMNDIIKSEKPYSESF